MVTFWVSEFPLCIFTNMSFNPSTLISCSERTFKFPHAGGLVAPYFYECNCKALKIWNISIFTAVEI
jgi:hypothetical protein